MMTVGRTKDIEQEADFPDHRMTGLEAFFTSVIAGVVLFAPGMALWAVYGDQPTDFGGVWAAIPILTLIVAALALPTMLAIAGTVGLALTAVLRRNRLEGPWVYPLAGLCTGSVSYWLITTEMSGWSEPYPRLDTLLGAATGCLCGWLWWKLAREPISYDGADHG